MAATNAALRGLFLVVLVAGLGTLSAQAQPDAAQDACAQPCAWVRTYGTGEGGLRPGPQTDHRLVDFVAARPDGGAIVAGMAIIGEERGIWLSGLTPTGAIAWERIEPGMLCAVADAGSGLLALISDRDDHSTRLSAFDASGALRWSLPLEEEEDIGAIAPLPDGGAVVAVEAGQGIDILHIRTGGFLFDREAAIERRDHIDLETHADVRPTAMALLPDGTLAVAVSPLGRQTPAFVLALDGEARVLWRTDFEQAAGPPPTDCLPGSATIDLAALADGGLIVNFVCRDDPGIWRSLAAALEVDGTVRWTWDPAEQDTERTMQSVADAVVPAADGGVLAVGTTHRPMRRTDQWTLHLGTDGTVDWQRDITQPADHGNLELLLAGIAEMPDGGALVVGTSGTRVMRMRAWAIRLAPQGIVAGGRQDTPADTGTPGPADLVGVWSARTPDGDPIVLTFMADGTLLLLDGGDIERGGYTTDFTTDPVSIDVTMDGDRFAGLLEFTAADTARIAMGRGQERPTSFQDGRIELLTLVRLSPRVQRTTAPTTAPTTTDDGTPTPAPADYVGSNQALIDLLSAVPSHLPERTAVLPVSYVDFDAIVGAAYARTVPGASLATVGFDDLIPAMMRVTAGPPTYLHNLIVIHDDMPGLLGIDVGDVRRALHFGMPPPWGMILGLDPATVDDRAIRTALDGRDFQRREVAGVTVWHRLDDGQIDIRNRNPGDPFGGYLGQSARIALLGPRLAGSPFWAIAEAMVAAAGDGPSLADDPDARAIADAVADPDGSLLQLYLIDPADTMAVPDAFAELVASGEAESLDSLVAESAMGPLPPYRMVGLADRFAGDRDEALIVLTYDDAETAEAAAAILADRLDGFRPASQPDAWVRRREDLAAVIAPSVVDPGDGGPAAAVVRVTYRAAFPSDEAVGGIRPTGGLIFRFLVEAWMRRELAPLMIAD